MDQIGDSGIVDLGALRSQREDGEGPRLDRIIGHPTYANDAKISLDASGTVTIEFFFFNNERVYDPLAVAIPVGVFMELAQLGPQVMEEVQQRMTRQMQRAAERGQQHPGSMEEARAARDRGGQ